MEKPPPISLNSPDRVRLSSCGRTRLRSGPSGIHFFDRASGWNLLIDEVILPRSEWTTGPRHISMALTNACDLGCAHCFVPKTKTHAALAFDRVVSWLNELDANGTLSVGFGGGEPTIYPRFADLCAYAANNTGLAVTFTTHGHNLDDTFLAMLKNKVHFIRVSMDGIGATYERLRKRPFNALRRRLDAIREIVPFGINYLVNDDTLPDITTAATFAKRAGAIEFLLLPERPVNGRTGVTREIIEALRSWVRGYSGGLRLAVSETDAEGMPTCNPLPHETGLDAYVHIDANGVLKRTSFDCDGVAIGHEGVLAAFWQLHQETQVTL